jgi:probable biosynthetic protein (TIGR04098 family)
MTALPPEVPRRLRVGMPHLDLAGLSENWLWRHAGDLHWEAISRRLAAASHELESDEGQRLYPTFVAVRARYQRPLAWVRENDRLDAAIEVVPCGRACAHGRFAAGVRGRRFELELLSTFAVRGAGSLKMALPAARLAARWTDAEAEPPIARLARAARRGLPLVDDFCGPSLEPPGPALGRLTYEPSPYADYNGAGLLYFASYVTIADTAERQLIRSIGPPPRPDWALATSPVRRDVFYYANLPLGAPLIVELLALERAPDRVRTRVRLRRADDDSRIADLVTERAMVQRSDSGPP